MKIASAKILKTRDDIVTVDLNHPLAGETLTFAIKVLEISEIKVSGAHPSSHMFLYL